MPRVAWFASMTLALSCGCGIPGLHFPEAFGAEVTVCLGVLGRAALLTQLGH